jgi:hypothetical protein
MIVALLSVVVDTQILVIPRSVLCDEESLKIDLTRTSLLVEKAAS